jgi:hypothetical protein
MNLYRKKRCWMNLKILYKETIEGGGGGEGDLKSLLTTTTITGLELLTGNQYLILK